MELELEIATNHKSFRTSIENSKVVLFTQNEYSFDVINLEDKSTQTVRSENRIKNIQIDRESVIVYHERIHVIYNINTLLCETTVVINDIIATFPLADLKRVYLRKNEMLVYQQNMMIEKSVFYKAFFIDGEYLCLVRPAALDKKQYKKTNETKKRPTKRETDGEISIAVFSRNKEKIYTKKLSVIFEKPVLEKTIDFERLHIDIRNKKIYVMEEDEIVGHDLHLYLDVVADMRPTSFKNMENEIILHDSNSGFLKYFQKNLKVLLFQCVADQYEYFQSKEILLTIGSQTFKMYKRSNVYKKPFKLIDTSVVYSEQEDEFDLSEDSYSDLP